MEGWLKSNEKVVIIMPAGYGGKWWRGTGSETIVRDTVAKWRKGWNPPLLLPQDFLQCPGKPLV